MGAVLNRQWRTVLGFLGAPLAPQAVILWASIKGGFVGQGPRWAIAGALVASYFLMSTSGVATHLLLTRRRRYERRAYTYTGGAIGIIAGMLVVVGVRLVNLLTGRADSLTFDTLVYIGLLGGCLMVIISTVFWYMARPDKP